MEERNSQENDKIVISFRIVHIQDFYINLSPIFLNVKKTDMKQNY